MLCSGQSVMGGRFLSLSMFLIRGTWTSPCWFGWYRFDFIHSQAEKASEVTHVLCFGEELSGITVSEHFFQCLTRIQTLIKLPTPGHPTTCHLRRDRTRLPDSARREDLIIMNSVPWSQWCNAQRHEYRRSLVFRLLQGLRPNDCNVSSL